MKLFFILIINDICLNVRIVLEHDSRASLFELRDELQLPQSGGEEQNKREERRAEKSLSAYGTAHLADTQTAVA